MNSANILFISICLNAFYLINFFLKYKFSLKNRQKRTEVSRKGKIIMVVLLKQGWGKVTILAQAVKGLVLRREMMLLHP